RNGGGAGTVYLRDRDQAQGTLIISNGSARSGWTPLGLPGQDAFTTPDAVIIQGANTQVGAEHAGLTLDFQSSLTIQQSANFYVESSHFVPHVAPVLSGAGFNVTGDFAPSWPVNLTNGS